MRNIKYKIITISVILLAWLCPFTVMADEEPGEKKPFTIMVYMVGSNLESEKGEATSDICEMAAAMSKEYSSIEDRVNLVIEYGGSNKWSLPELAGSASGHGRFEITGNGVENLTQLEDTSMGDAKTLSEFISYGITNYPAKKYILVFWNHGSGAIDGFGYDECHKGDSLRLLEIREAFETSGMEDYDFAMVGFDACLMGGIETACSMPENVEYMTASASLEPLDGWDYGWITVLDRDDVTGKEISEYIADRYYAYYEAKGEKAPITMASFNLESVRQFTKLFGNAVMKQIAEEGEDEYFSRLTEKRADFYCYDAANYFSGRAEFIDMRYLLEGLNAIDDEEKLQLSGLLNGAIDVRKSNIPGQAAGVSVYLPNKHNVLVKRDCALYGSMTFMEPYKNMVSSYYSYLTRGGTGRIVSVESFAYIPVGQRGLALVLSDETDVETAEIQWSAETGVIMDNEQDYLIIGGRPVYYQCAYKGEEFENLLCPVLCKGEPLVLLIRVHDESGAGELLEAYPVNTAGNMEKGVGDSINGENLIPLYPMINIHTGNGELPKDEGVEGIAIDGNMYFMGESVVVPENGELSISMAKAAIDNVETGIHITNDGQDTGNYY